MAIVKDLSRNTYYINYKRKLPNGKWQNINIRNKAWKIEGEDKVSVRYMKSIEHAEIEKDKGNRHICYHSGDNVSLEQLCEGFYVVCNSEGMDYETIYGYKLTFKNYLFQALSPTLDANEAFKVHNMDTFRAFLVNKGISNKTINNKMVAVKNLIKYAKKRKHISRELADEAIDALEPLKDHVRLGEKENFFSNGEEDVRKFIYSFEKEDVEWRVPVLLMFYGALRVGEWQAIDRKSINFDNDSIIINKQIDNHGKLKNHTKTGHDRIVNIPHSFMLELKAYIDNRSIKENDFIFMSSHCSHVSRHKIRQIVDKHLSLAGVEHITLHGLRHSFATRMFDKGYDVKEVQEHLGHTSMETTMQYYIHYTKAKNKKDMEDLV